MMISNLIMIIMKTALIGSPLFENTIKTFLSRKASFSKCKQSHKCANHTLNFNVHNKNCHKFAPRDQEI